MTLDSTPSGTPTPLTPPPTGPTTVATSPVVAGPTGSVATTPRAARSRGSGRFLNIVLGIAAVVAIGGVAFAVGRTTAPVAASTVTAGRGNGGTGFVPDGSFVPGGNGGPGFVRGGFAGSPTVSGTVESIDGDTLTIKTASGQTVKVTMDASTTYHNQAPADASDVTTGSTVEVQVQLDGTGAARPQASGAPTGPIGTAGSVTVVP